MLRSLLVQAHPVTDPALNFRLETFDQFNFRSIDIEAQELFDLLETGNDLLRNSIKESFWNEATKVQTQETNQV